MYKSGSNCILNGKHTIRYRGTKRDCLPCQVRAKLSGPLCQDNKKSSLRW
jgi:hypothetical protein